MQSMNIGKNRFVGNTKLVILPIVVGMLAVASFLYLFIQKPLDYKKFSAVKEISNETITPTPVPFWEMTIPALRAREYKSVLGPLEKLSENESYISYLTSYDSDGLKINGLLTIPKNEDGEKTYPAIVFVHGYIPPEKYKTEVNYKSYVDSIAKSGFVVFKIDLRGHGQSEGVPAGAYYSEDYVVDTLNAVEALRTSNFVKPDSIGLWGHSMAGNVVFRSFVVRKNVPAVVIWAGAGYTYTDLQDFRIQDKSYRPAPTDSLRARERQKLIDTYGNFDANNAFWKQVPATNFLEGVGGSIQIHHAVDDNVVSIEYSRNLEKILKTAGIKHELNEYKTGGHNLTGQTFNEAIQRTIRFFRDNLSAPDSFGRQ